MYRDGALYALDPHDQEADRCAFRLGLKPPKAAVLPVARPDAEPLPSPNKPLGVADFDVGLRDGVPGSSPVSTGCCFAAISPS